MTTETLGGSLFTADIKDKMRIWLKRFDPTTDKVSSPCFSKLDRLSLSETNLILQKTSFITSLIDVIVLSVAPNYYDKSRGDIGAAVRTPEVRQVT